MKTIAWLLLSIFSLCVLVLAAVFLTGCATPMRDNVPVTTLAIDPATHQVTLSNPKDTTIKNFAAAVTTNGATVTFDSLTTVMNPDVITTTSDGQAKLIDANSRGVKDGILSAVSLLKGLPIPVP